MFNDAEHCNGPTVTRFRSQTKMKRMRIGRCCRAAQFGLAAALQCAFSDNVDQATPAPVVKVSRRNISSDLEIASEILPYQEIDVYAKVSGYTQKLYDVDWGTHVKQGQLLAVLEIPELEQQTQSDQASVERAAEELNRAKSSYTVAPLTYQRLHDVQKTQPELVAQQDIDVAAGKDVETNAAGGK